MIGKGILIIFDFKVEINYIILNGNKYIQNQGNLNTRIYLLYTHIHICIRTLK